MLYQTEPQPDDFLVLLKLVVSTGVEPVISCLMKPGMIIRFTLLLTQDIFSWILVVADGFESFDNVKNTIYTSYCVRQTFSVVQWNVKVLLP